MKPTQKGIKGCATKKRVWRSPEVAHKKNQKENMDVPLPEDTGFDQASMKADIDSIYLLTRTMDAVPEMLDTLCREGSTLSVVNLIS